MADKEPKKKVNKKKVKYYPALCNENGIFFVTNTKFSSKPHVRLPSQFGIKFIRFITEIPELIEEREE
jgi:hypothetical protein